MNKKEYDNRLELYKKELESACDNFKELICSNLVDIRSGCIGLITRDKDASCIESVGIVMKYCPFCGCEIKSRYNLEKGYWEWWHN